MVSKTSKLLQSGKSTTTGAGVITKTMVSKIPKFTKSMAGKPITKGLISRVGAGLFGPAAVALTVIGSAMRKDSPMSKALKEQRMKIIEDRAKDRLDGKPMKNRTKKGPDMRARKSAMSDAQKKAGGSTGRDALREAGRGKAGPKRNVLKRGSKFGGSGVVKNQGKAVKTGKGTAAYKRMMEKRKNR